ncbi:hypothetical protein [Conexibacter sp. SYSU D00693]|uniref:hypothetical protein n=1 Tax=Conexibacter sp. SYSU D00693 TaxID=2812560 RepID=UPI00196B4FA1|nr:hypothetical protein [Conexibacter sp. SYSU D00693]
MLARRACTAALAVAAAAGLGACTSSQSNDSAEDFQGEQRRVAQVVEDLEEKGGTRDGGEICQDLLADGLRQSIQRASGEACESALEDALKDVDTFDLDVERVQVSGNRATVTVKGEGGGSDRTDTLTLERGRQGWRITGLGQ